MRKVAIFLLSSLMAYSQGRPLDWPSYGNDAQRTGWEKVDTRITKDNVKDFQLVLKRTLDNGQSGPNSLTPPVILGLLISYRGFKELGFVAGSGGNMWAIDVDVDRIFWQKHVGAAAKGKCAAGGTPMPALIPPLNFAMRPRPATPPPASATPAATAPAPAPATTQMPPPEPPTRPLTRATIAAGGFGAPRPLFAVSSDGKLHLLNTSTGEDASPAMPFLPSNAMASDLTVVDSTVYAATTDCGNGHAAVWALDLKSPDKKSPPVAKFAINDGAVSKLGGLAMANDGTVFVQAGKTLYGLTTKTLKPASSFTFPDTAPDTTPVIFTYKDKEVVATVGPQGRLYLLDAKNPGNPLFQSEPLPSGRIWGGLSTWLDTSGTRWILAPVWGDKGAIVAFKLEDHKGKPVLKQGWVSREMTSPEQPVITSGLVFALSSGDHAVLYALDGTSGKELWSSGTQVKAPANLTGLTVANGRVFFTTTDNTLYSFGVYLER